MNLMNQKFRNIISSILTTCYLFSLLAAIFHYHQIELLTDEQINLTPNKVSSHYQIIFDSNYACIIQHNLTNLQTSLLVLSSEHRQVFSENIIFRIDSDGLFRSQFKVSDNLLRAPPYFS